MQTKLLRIIKLDFDTVGQLLIRYSTFIRYWRNTRVQLDNTSDINTGLNKAYNSIRKEVLYNILIEFGISLKHVKLIKFV
jgi:hypothetical protein